MSNDGTHDEHEGYGDMRPATSSCEGAKDDDAAPQAYAHTRHSTISYIMSAVATPVWIHVSDATYRVQ